MTTFGGGIRKELSAKNVGLEVPNIPSAVDSSLSFSPSSSGRRLSIVPTSTRRVTYDGGPSLEDAIEGMSAKSPLRHSVHNAEGLLSSTSNELFQQEASGQEKSLRLVKSCELILSYKIYHAINYVALLISLFGYDSAVLLDSSDSFPLEVLLSLIFGWFFLDMLLHVAIEYSYRRSSLVWVDVLGTLMLIFDIRYMRLAFSFNHLRHDTKVARFLRILQLYARTIRLSRLVRLRRLFSGGSMPQNPSDECARDIADTLIVRVTSCAVCWIFLPTLMIPMICLFREAKAFSPHTWLDSLEESVTKHPDRLLPFLMSMQSFYSGANFLPFSVYAKNDLSLPMAAQDVLPWSNGSEPPCEANIEVFESASLVVLFDFRETNHSDAKLNIVIVLFNMVATLLVTCVITLSTHHIVTKPLQRTMKKIYQMRKKISDALQDTDVQRISLRSSDKSLSFNAAFDTLGLWTMSHCVARDIDLLRGDAARLAALNKRRKSQDTLAIFHVGSPEATQGEGQRSATKDVNFAHEGSSSGSGRLDRQVADAMASLQNPFDTWNLNALEIDEARIHAGLFFFMSPANHGFSFDAMKLSNFLRAAQAGYSKANKFSNCKHAFETAHSCHRLTKLCNSDSFLSPLEQVGLIVSAIFHDIGHPGLTNSCLIETGHELALRYNDSSPLENASCANLFEILAKAECNIFSSFSSQEFNELRNICIHAILHTDESLHFDLLQDMRACLMEFHRENGERHVSVKSNPLDIIDLFSERDSRRIVMDMFLRLSDNIYHCKSFMICQRWALLACEEFFSQGEMERRMGLPVRVIFDCNRLDVSLSQIRFLDCIVSPLILEMTSVFRALSPLSNQMLDNARSWLDEWLEENPHHTEEMETCVLDRIYQLEDRHHQARAWAT